MIKFFLIIIIGFYIGYILMFILCKNEKFIGPDSNEIKDIYYFSYKENGKNICYKYEPVPYLCPFKN